MCSDVVCTYSFFGFSVAVFLHILKEKRKGNRYLFSEMMMCKRRIFSFGLCTQLPSWGCVYPKENSKNLKMKFGYALTPSLTYTT